MVVTVLAAASNWERLVIWLPALVVGLGLVGAVLILLGRAFAATVRESGHPRWVYGGLVALGNRANIDQVIVDGRVLIDAGRYIHGDETAIISAASAAIGKIWDLPEAQAAFNG